MKKRFTEDQIISPVVENAGIAVVRCCAPPISEVGNYLWQSKHGGISVSDAKRLTDPEAENN
jgi:putative transposase